MYSSSDGGDFVSSLHNSVNHSFRMCKRLGVSVYKRNIMISKQYWVLFCGICDQVQVHPVPFL